MVQCFNFAALLDRFYRLSFSAAGLRSATTDIGDDTVMHCWVPKNHIHTKPNLLLIHGVGASAIWQWNSFIRPLVSQFNVYVPDLVFFGGSRTTRPDRSEEFQARCVMRAMEAHGVRRIKAVGLSYGGFVAYSMAAQFPEAVEKLVLLCAGVCMEDKDLKEGMFEVESLEEGTCLLLPQTTEKWRELVGFTFYKPVRFLPSWFLNDFIQFMCRVNVEERKELLQAIYKDRKLSDIPTINRPILIIWGEHDRIFPLELGHRLKRHLGENAQLVILKDAGHAINVEKPKEISKHLKSFLIDSLPSPKHNGHGDDHSDNHKVD